MSSGYFTDSVTGYGVYGDYFVKTTNGGSYWNVQFYPGILNYEIKFLNNLTGFAVGENGKIYKTTNSGEPNGINLISNNIPFKYSLEQNYPNPFNPTTNIKFDIPKRSNVKISVFDVLGKEVSVLVNEEINSGTFEVNWDASNFPSGVYFYKIESDGFIESKKMILLK